MGAYSRSSVMSAADVAVLRRAQHSERKPFERVYTNERLARQVSRARQDAARPTRPARTRGGGRGAREGARGGRVRVARKGRAGAAATARQGQVAATQGRASVAARTRAGGGTRAMASSPTRHRALIVLAFAVVSILALYGPAADVYAAYRDHGRLLAEQARMEQVTEDLKAQIEVLRTEEGIKDAARERGYVPVGEVAVDAASLVGEEEQMAPPDLSSKVDEGPEPWYIQVLDTVLGYQERTT